MGSEMCIRDSSYTASAKKDGESFNIHNLSIDQDRISFVIKDSLIADKGAIRFLGNIEESSIKEKCFTLTIVGLNGQPILIQE